MPMWCVAPLEMNEANSLGERVQSAYKAVVPKKPHTLPLSLTFKVSSDSLLHQGHANGSRDTQDGWILSGQPSYVGNH